MKGSFDPRDRPGVKNIPQGRRDSGCSAESVSLAAVVDVGHYDVTGLIEAEKSVPLADAQALPAFQRTLQRLDVAATVRCKRLQGENDACRVGAVHAGEFALSGRLIDEEPFHRPSRCFNSP